MTEHAADLEGHDYVVERAGRTLVVARAHVDAARLKMRRVKARGGQVDPAVEAIAQAIPRSRTHADPPVATTPQDRGRSIEALMTEGVVYDKTGDKIGWVGQVYLDDESGGPEWITVKTGLFGGGERLVPVREGRREGPDLHLPFDKDTIRNAPAVAEDGHLSPEQEQDLYRYYGIGDNETTITLPEERVVIDEESSPVERIRIDTEHVTTQEEVTEAVRAEETDTGSARRDYPGT